MAHVTKRDPPTMAEVALAQHHQEVAAKEAEAEDRPFSGSADELQLLMDDRDETLAALERNALRFKETEADPRFTSGPIRHGTTAADLVEEAKALERFTRGDLERAAQTGFLRGVAQGQKEARPAAYNKGVDDGIGTVLTDLDLFVSKRPWWQRAAARAVLIAFRSWR